jgi:RHS repeat-associated protein
LKGKYDAWNRLVEVRNTSGNLIATYEYNGLNQRIKKTVGSTVTKSFFNEKWQELESQTGTQITSYIWGLRYIDDLVLREKNAERLYSLADPNWNVVGICDSTGDIQERYIYDAFGKWNIFNTNFVSKAGTALGWNRAFTGQVLDFETGLMLYRNRYYHIGLGRFVNRDPMEYYRNSTNLYQYVKNNPALLFDTYGLMFVYEDEFPVDPFQENPSSPSPINTNGSIEGYLGGMMGNSSFTLFDNLMPNLPAGGCGSILLNILFPGLVIDADKTCPIDIRNYVMFYQFASPRHLTFSYHSRCDECEKCDISISNSVSFSNNLDGSISLSPTCSITVKGTVTTSLSLSLGICVKK